jgi:glycosyltransferase involved in cell wall biosynthesis
MIAKVVSQYSKKYPGLIHYYENTENLGYDANLRNLIKKARGEYCLFMGNDDLMCKDALTKVNAALHRYPNIGVLLRSYAAFDGKPSNIVQTFRYFDRDLFFPAGAETINTIYRRSIVISGMVLHRSTALSFATNYFDGSLLYQLYLVAMILTEMNAVYSYDITVLYRNGGVPDFGNSVAEKEKFKPQDQTPESSVHFIRGMLSIAQYVENSKKVQIFKAIRRDIANYSYPYLAIQAKKPLPDYLKYTLNVGLLGLGRYPMFYIWIFVILIFGVDGANSAIKYVKNKLGYTPHLGGIYKGGDL